MAETPDVISALTADGAAFDALVADLADEQWGLPTPAPGWTVAHQVAHVAATLKLAGLAAGAPEQFKALAATLSPDFDANVNAALAPFLAAPPKTLLSLWRQERDRSFAALAAVPADQPVPWLVRPLPPAVLACAGMMELFAHGQDIADAVGVRRLPTDRLAFLVGFAVRVWDFGYLARGLEVPQQEFRFEITTPSGRVLEFGPIEATQRITGPAEDFCLLVTRRRHPADLAVKAEGSLAEHWLEIAQAYRGTPGEGRTPGQFGLRRAA